MRTSRCRFVYLRAKSLAVPPENSVWSLKGSPKAPRNNVTCLALVSFPPVNFDLDVADS
jgi:hypothetical protein